MSCCVCPAPCLGIVRQKRNILCYDKLHEFAEYRLRTTLMHKLSLDEVRAIADLARLTLSEDEVARYAAQLSQILSYFQALQAVDTSDVPPIASVLLAATEDALRADGAPVALSPAEAVANAPQAENNQFKVSAVLDE